MKKLILGIIIGFSLTGLISAGILNYTASNRTAEVITLQNFKVFTDCEPVAEYTYIGTVDNGSSLSMSSQYQPVRDALIKKARKKYPDADGIIFHFVNGKADQADIIKFK